MREILFRGKRLDNGAWETGSLVTIRYGMADEQVYICDKMTGYHTPVDPETVGQYIGIKGEGEKRIFEGDILWDTGLSSPEDKTIVIFKDGLAGFMLQEILNPKKRQGFAEWYNNRLLRIVGNIHDNPELLKEG